MNQLLTTTFAVSDISLATEPLKEIPYPHAVHGLLRGKSTFGELKEIDWNLIALNARLLELDEPIEVDPVGGCPCCQFTGNCACKSNKNSGSINALCKRCKGSGKCAVCDEQGRLRDRNFHEKRRSKERSELKQRRNELEKQRAIVAESLEAQIHSPVPGLESCSRYHGSLVTDICFHPVLAAVHYAFCDHRPISLSPDMIWLLIVQGTANHINAHAEALRPMFVKHQGKAKLLVRRDDFIKGSPENPWGEVFPEFTRQIREHVGDDTHDFFVANFSTTGKVEKAAYEVVLMDAMQSYFTYEVHTLCGIPAITLEGTPEDWHNLLERVQMLPHFDLGWWQKILEPILQQFIDAAEGNPDLSFWRSIYKLKSQSGGDTLTGWMTAFFPYLRDTVSKLPTKQNSWLTQGGQELQNQLYPGDPTQEGYEPGLTTDQLPIGLARAPFLWQYFKKQFEMEFLAGFVGIAQDPQTLCLRPEIGWVICQANTTLR
ncbi:MAG: DUF4419 domain-containing protein [Gemmatales bacterium]